MHNPDQVHHGQKALAAFVTQVGAMLGRYVDQETAARHAEKLWPDFAAAVNAACAQARENEATGVRRWQEARHGGGKELAD